MGESETLRESPEGRIEPLSDRLGALFVVLALAMILVPLAVRGVSAAVPAWAGSPAFQTAALLLQQGVLLGLTLWRLRAAGSTWTGLRPYVEGAGQFWTAVGWGLGLLFLNGFCAQLSIALLQALVGPEGVRTLLEREQSVVARLLDPGAGPFFLGATVFTAVFLAPIVEETFFRGYAYAVLKLYAKEHAAWLSALLFAGVHLYAVNFLPLFVLGYALARMYERTGSLAVTIVAHATVNAAVAVINVLVRSAAERGTL